MVWRINWRADLLKPCRLTEAIDYLQRYISRSGKKIDMQSIEQIIQGLITLRLINFYLFLINGLIGCWLDVCGPLLFFCPPYSCLFSSMAAASLSFSIACRMFLWMASSAMFQVTPLSDTTNVTWIIKLDVEQNFEKKNTMLPVSLMRCVRTVINSE